MKEHLTEAVVLHSRSHKEQDRIGEFFTKDFGRIEARIVGGGKILTKLGSHSNVLNYVMLRTVQKNQLTVTDIIEIKTFPSVRGNVKLYGAALEAIFLIRALLPPGVPDLPLWHHLLRSLETAKVTRESFLKLFGYDPAPAYCAECGEKPVVHFSLRNHSFLCKTCYAPSPKKDLVLVQ